MEDAALANRGQLATANEEAQEIARHKQQLESCCADLEVQRDEAQRAVSRTSVLALARGRISVVVKAICSEMRTVALMTVPQV
jgi:hypothetical protein